MGTRKWVTSFDVSVNTDSVAMDFGNSSDDRVSVNMNRHNDGSVTIIITDHIENCDREIVLNQYGFAEIKE